MLKHLRASYRIVRVVWWFFYSYWKVKRNRKKSPCSDFAEECLRAGRETTEWAAGCLRLINMELRVHGDRGKFTGGLVVSNHQSFLDIITHASVFNLRFTPKLEMSRWWLLNKLTALNMPIWVDRKNRAKSLEVAQAIEWSMVNHIPLIIYPEGTTNHRQNGLLPFKSTPFEPVLKLQLPIQPIITLFSSSSPNPDAMSWKMEETLISGVWRVLGLEKMTADVYIMPTIIPDPGMTRKELAVKVHDLMEREYWRIRNHDNI